MSLVGLDQLAGFGLAALVVIVIPGPSVVFVVGRAVSWGRRVALASVLGNTLGLGVVMALVCLGLGALVAESQVLFTVLKLAGASYLIWLGVQAIRRRGDLVVVDGDSGPASPPGLSFATAVRQGFIVGVSNPKGFIIFAAMLPPFVDSGGTRVEVASQMLQLGAVAVLLGLVCDSLWALAAGRARDWFVASQGRSRALGAAGGASMVGLGVVMAFSGRAH